MSECALLLLIKDCTLSLQYKMAHDHDGHSLLYRCTCQNCATDLLVNVAEAKCCREALQEQRVIEEMGQESAYIAQHPGFAAVCFNVWSLQVSASNFTHHEARYKRTGSEQR